MEMEKDNLDLDFDQMPDSPFDEFTDIIKYHHFANDLGNEKYWDTFRNDIVIFLYNKGYDMNEINRINFQLKFGKEGSDYIKIIAHNLITALWFSDVYPSPIPDKSATEAVIDNVKYVYTPSKLKIINLNAK